MSSSIPDGTNSRLRADIDHGRTGDKVDWPDPAAAPLGTDDEAAGAPMPAGAAEAARRRETRGPTHAPQRQGRLGAAWVMAAILLLAGIAAAIWIVKSV